MHVAIVSFGYPPLPHVSSKRPRHMAREIRAAGNKVSVVTVDWRWPQPEEWSTPKVAVRRSTEEEGVRVVRVDPRLRYPAFDPRAIPRSTEQPVSGNRLRRKCATLWRAVTWGPFASWGRDALSALIELHNDCPVDVVWAIHGDATAHEVAHRFALRTRVPWVADFKDPWDLFIARVGRPLVRLATKRRLSNAAALTETCSAQAARDRATFRLSTHTIWSGYEPALMEEAAESTRDPSRFAIMYMGHAGAQHDIDRLPRALARLAVDAPELATNVVVECYSSDARAMTSRFHVYGQSHRLESKQFVPERAAFALMRSADVLVLFPAVNGGSVGVKELEYMASGTPVLVLGELLEELKCILPPNSQVFEARTDVEAVEFLAGELRSSGRIRRAPVNQPFVAKFSWTNQALLLRTVLEDAAHLGPSKHPIARIVSDYGRASVDQ